ncbi:hypothetical protein JCM16358_22770 [Halanaerocella petrolearia]
MLKIKKAEIVARKFLQKHRLKVPLDIEQVASLLNIKITYGSFVGDGAILYKEEEISVIAANKDQDPGQLRFNLAHEMSHCLLKHRGKIFRTYKGKNKPVYEKCADACASELLMPRNELKRKSFELSGDVQKLKEYFVVSEQAVVTKMKILKLPYTNTFYK